MYFAGLRIANPELDRRGRDILESESLSIRTPHWRVWAGTRRKRHMNLRSIGDVYELEFPDAGCDSITAWGIVPAVIFWFYACAGKA
jgi:hypothetical protein